MRHNFFNAVLRLAPLALASVLVPPARAQQTASIEGQVRNVKGIAIGFGVTVRLETAEGSPVAQVPVDSEGRFSFEQLAKKAYRLTALGTGFQPAQQDVNLAYSGDKVFVSLYLQPAASLNRPGRAALIDSRVSKKARREYEKGKRAFERGDLPEARARFDQAVRAYPCYAPAQTDLATVLGYQHELAATEAAFKKAIECDPGYLEAYIRFAMFLNGSKRFPESEAILNEGLRRAPSAWQFYYQLASAYSGAGDYAKARDDYLKVLALNPAPPAEIHTKLADLYMREDAYGQAYAEMQAYLRADPNGRSAPKVRRIMQEMEASGVLRSGSSKSAPHPQNGPSS